MDQKLYFESLVDKILVKTYLNDVQVEVSAGSKTGDNYLGDLSKIIVRKGGETKSFYIKRAATDPKFRETMKVSDVYLREAICYDKIFPKMDKIQDELNVDEKNRFRHVKCLHTCLEENHEVILMEDLTQFGYRTLDRLDVCDWDLLQLTIKTLANFNAMSFYMKDKHPEDFEESTKVLKAMAHVGDHFIDVMTEGMRQSQKFIENAEYKEKFDKLLPNLKERIMALFDYKPSEPYGVLAQGDCWAMNLMFKFEDNKPVDLIILDWQWGQITSPIVDLSTVLFTNTDTETRQKHYHECYELYYSQLGKRLREMGSDIDKCYPRHVFEEQIKFFSLFGIVIGIISCSFIHAEEGLDLMELAKEGADFKHCPASIKQMNEIVNDVFRFGLL